MDSIEDDEFIDNEYDGLDYNVIDRPEELVNEQKRVSTSKILIESTTVEKPDFATLKRFLTSRKHASKNREREKKTSSRHEKKGSSKEKTSFKSPLDEGSPVKKSAELSKRFENLRKMIRHELGHHSKSKQKAESSKILRDERSSPIPKSKKFSQETDKILGIPVSKIMKEPALTPMQRFRVLDARDSELRANVSKPEGKKKIVIIGTCPDMCPEKERYGRIAKNCVSILEMTSTFDPNASIHEADHSCMVKEYSRSSADQQEPLPHELRPVSVLKLTMDYLICNVIDKCHESISLEDWYDFIWNRTRSIRKDITQQQLCDPTSVEIIEKCVRFHIHCAEALSEEDTAAFDPKINNENLTKCLQTLKHMYQDLLSKGIQSPNEAEFRSYDILLSLTEGETLRIIKDIRKDLLKSPLIRFAFKAALAFNSDNYVKFFQIIENADYLSSCILHRYIIKVRSNALQIIVRAYSTQHNASMYPLSRLVNDLKFENEAEAADFCQCHGLEVNEEFIIIDRKQFSRSPSGLPLSRSSLLVGQKKGRHLGLIINKGILPQNPKFAYQPYNSFDENNVLKIDCLFPVAEDHRNDLCVDERLEQEDEEMEIEDIFSMRDDYHSCDTKFEKSSKIGTLLQDSPIEDLEKRRAELLEEIDKVKSGHCEKLKQTRDQRSKIEKKKSSKTSRSSSKPHQSVTFSTEKADNIKPHKNLDDIPENIFSPVASSASSNKLLLHKDSSVIKFSKSSTKAFASVCTSNSVEQFPLSKTFTTASGVPVTSSETTNVFRQPSLPNFGFPTLSFSEPQDNFGFPFKSITPASFSNSAFFTKHAEIQQQWKPDIAQSIIEQIANVEVTQTLPKETTMPQQLAPDIIFGDSENCNKQVIQKGTYKRDTEKSIYLPQKKVDQLEEAETTSKIGEVEISQVITSEILKDDSKGSDKEVIKESDNECDTEERQKQELVSRFVDEIADQVLSGVVEECLPSVCEEVLNEERQIKMKLDNEAAAISEQLAKYAIFRWRLFVQKRREKRIYENLAFYSPWQAILLNIPRISSGAISPFVAYKKHCSLTKTAADILKKRFEVPPGWEKINAEQVWTFNSFKPHSSYVDASYFGSSRIKNFFKLCIVFPHAKDPNMTLFMEWMCAKFALEKTDFSQFDCRNVFRLHQGETAVVVRAIELTPDVAVKHASFLDGTTAMMLFVPCDSKDRESFFKNLTILRDLSILDSPFPLYMYFMGLQDIPSDITSYVEMKIDISFTAVNMQCIPDINNFAENSQKILNGLLWFNELKDKARPLPILKKVSFRHYVEDAFSYAFSILLCKVSLDEYKFLLEDPQFIIDFYNRVMMFRASVLCNDFIKGIHSCWPPEEIKDLIGGNFINIQTQNLCKKALENLVLPDFKGDPYDDSNIWEYARLVPSSSSNIVLSIKISDSSVDWVRKIIYCAEHLIQNSDFMLNKGDLPVFYIYEDLLDFGCDPYWLNVLAEVLPHRNNTKRKSIMFESCSPLKKLKGISSSTPKAHENVQTIYGKPMKEDNAFEDSYILNCKLSLMAVDSERKSLGLCNEKLLNTWTKSDLFEFNKENDFLEIAKSSSYKVPSRAIGSERKTPALSYNTLLNANIEKDVMSEDDNWKDIGIKKPSGNTWSSLADRISELQYNIQKNNVLEDHFYELLNKQL